jgi:hypothetical protein
MPTWGEPAGSFQFARMSAISVLVAHALLAERGFSWLFSEESVSG